MSGGFRRALSRVWEAQPRATQGRGPTIDDMTWGPWAELGLDGAGG